ncbi:hypothetical protein [Erythrobacter sp.]|uniref:hypothetical protein n=1 Tax=Erythrobacter sp. TaxID=1042 RepID=UPI0025FA7634|nr:hypothetical protein [Erythrobacter sp.]
MSGFYAAFNVTGDGTEIRRFKEKMFRSYDEYRGEYGPYRGSDSSVIIDFTAACPKLTAERIALEKKWPRAYSPELRGYDVDQADYEDGEFWFQFTVDGEFPVAAFEAIAAEFPSLHFSGSAYEETHEFEYEGEFNGDQPWQRAKLNWL